MTALAAEYAAIKLLSPVSRKLLGRNDILRIINGINNMTLDNPDNDETRTEANVAQTTYLIKQWSRSGTSNNGNDTVALGKLDPELTRVLNLPAS